MTRATRPGLRLRPLLAMIAGRGSLAASTTRPPATAAAAPESEKLALERIDALVGNSRAIWFTQLAFLAFTFITLLSVRDLDFFSVSARIDVPLLGVTIPTATFFIVAPWLAAVLHVYFHLFLLRLWDALADAPPTIDSLPLGERVFPWLVVDWALRRRVDRPVTRRPMDGLGSVVTGFLIWLATPLLVAAFWWRSMPAHDAWLTLAIGAALLLSLYASLRGWRRSRHRLKTVGREHTVSRRLGLLGQLRRLPGIAGGLLLWLGMLAMLPLMIFVSLAGAGWHHLPEAAQPFLEAHWPADKRLRPPLARANLVGADLVEKPADWLGRDTAERRFRITWCRDRQIPADACEPPTEPYHTAAREAWCGGDRAIEDCAAEFLRLDLAFDQEWQEQRGEYLANLTKPDLAGRDLRGADARGAFLAGIDLHEARLEGADFSRARLERANLTGANLEGARLYAARLEDAYLEDANLERANLQDARLEGADLFRATLRRASLVGARLERANLTGANLERTNLEGANLNGAWLGRAAFFEARLVSVDWAGAIFAATSAHAADFTGGRDLTQNQLDQVIADELTILPLDAETDAQHYAWTCWAEAPSTLDGLLQRWPEFLGELIELSCPPGIAPERTGRPPPPPLLFEPGADYPPMRPR